MKDYCFKITGLTERDRRHITIRMDFFSRHPETNVRVRILRNVAFIRLDRAYSAVLNMMDYYKSRNRLTGSQRAMEWYDRYTVF